jgi:hypothetical protein
VVFFENYPNYSLIMMHLLSLQRVASRLIFVKDVNELPVDDCPTFSWFCTLDTPETDSAISSALLCFRFSTAPVRITSLLKLSRYLRSVQIIVITQAIDTSSLMYQNVDSL